MLINGIVTCACICRIVCAAIDVTICTAVCISISLLWIISLYQILGVCHTIRQLDSRKRNTVVASFSGCLNLIAIFSLCIRAIRGTSSTSCTACITSTTCIHRFRAIFCLILALHENIMVNILSVMTCRQSLFIYSKLVIGIELIISLRLLCHLITGGTLVYSVHIYKGKLCPVIALTDIALLIRLIIKRLCVILFLGSNRRKLCFQFLHIGRPFLYTCTIFVRHPWQCSKPVVRLLTINQITDGCHFLVRHHLHYIEGLVLAMWADYIRYSIERYICIDLCKAVIQHKSCHNETSCKCERYWNHYFFS